MNEGGSSSGGTVDNIEGHAVWKVPFLGKQRCQALVKDGGFIAHTSCGWKNKRSEGGAFPLVSLLFLRFMLPVHGWGTSIYSADHGQCWKGSLRLWLCYITEDIDAGWPCLHFRTHIFFNIFLRINHCTKVWPAIKLGWHSLLTQ